MIGLLALLTLGPAAVLPQAAGARPDLLIVVRQNTQRRLSADMLRRIGEEAARIWRPYLTIAFRSADDLSPSRGDETIDLLLTDRQSNGRMPSGLGWIDFVDGEPSRTVTISVGAVEELAVRGKWGGRPLAAWPPALRDLFLARALGRSTAHEIGHYVLRSKEHTPDGLMRARFTVAEIMTNGLGQYRLRPADVESLKRRATSDALARGDAEDAEIRN